MIEELREFEIIYENPETIINCQRELNNVNYNNIESRISKVFNRNL